MANGSTSPNDRLRTLRLERRPPRSTGIEQLALFERLAPEPRLIPADWDERTTMFGLAQDRDRPLLTENVSLLGACLRDVRVRHPFTIDALVVLPDHLHCIWTLPEGDSNFSTRRRLIKSIHRDGAPWSQNGHSERRMEPIVASR